MATKNCHNTYDKKQGEWQTHGAGCGKLLPEEVVVRKLRQISRVRPHFTLILLWVKIPMERQMRTGVRSPGQRETQRAVIPTKQERISSQQCFWMCFPVFGAHFVDSQHGHLAHHSPLDKIQR